MEMIIAIDVCRMLQKVHSFRNVFDILMRANNITGHLLNEETLPNAEVLIRPPVSEYLWYEFDKGNEIIQAGEKETYEHLGEIRNMYQRNAQ